MDLRAVDRDHPDLRQPRLGAQPQDVAEQSGERCLVALAKTRNRRVIRHLIRRDHPEGDPQHTPARSPAKNAGPSRRRRATARPSSPDRAPDGHDQRDGRRRRTPTNPSPQQPPTRTTRDGPPAATPLVHPIPSRFSPLRSALRCGSPHGGTPEKGGSVGYDAARSARAVGALASGDPKPTSRSFQLVAPGRAPAGSPPQPIVSASSAKSKRRYRSAPKAITRPDAAAATASRPERAPGPRWPRRPLVARSEDPQSSWRREAMRSHRRIWLSYRSPGKPANTTLRIARS